MVEHAVNRYGRLDVAFNNAGINIGVAPIANVEDAQWDIKDGIRINAVCPGGTYTAMLAEWFKDPEVERTAKAATPIGRMADPAEIARAVLFLASEESSFMLGHALVVDGGLTAQ